MSGIINTAYETAKKLTDLLNEKNIDEISIEADNIKIRVKAKQTAQIVYDSAVAARSAEGALPTNSPTPKGDMVKSPIVGTFYAAPAPDKPPFVKIGDRVEKGQVVCIVESMKLMNEITSDFSGTVSEIYSKDGEAVEYEQNLILIV